jgi:hypothetical protein
MNLKVLVKNLSTSVGILTISVLFVSTLKAEEPLNIENTITLGQFSKNGSSSMLILSNGYHFILRQRYHPLRDAFIS